MRQLEEALHLIAGQDRSVDTKELIDRVEQQISQEGVPVVAMDRNRTMQTQEKPRQITQTRLPKRVWVFAAALAAVVMAIGIPVWLFGGEDAETVTEPVAATTTTAGEVETTLDTADTVPVPTEPTTVFSWSDDLSEWVTEDEMTDLLEDLSTRYYADTGGDLGGKAVLARPGGDLVWGVGYWSVGVHAGGGYHPFPTRTNPRLPQGVTYEPISQSYVFSGPNSGQSICITLTTPGTTASIEEEPNYETIFFALASMMLQEMGWAD